MDREQMHVCKDLLLDAYGSAKKGIGHQDAAAIYLVGARLLSVLFEIREEISAPEGLQFVTLPTPVGVVHLDPRKIVAIEDIKDVDGACNVLLDLGSHHGIRIQLSAYGVLTRLGCDDGGG